MSTTTLLEEDRRSLSNHRKRGLPVFWIGFFITFISFWGMLARLDGAPQNLARQFLGAIPPGGSFYRENFYFQFQHAPFASIITLIGLALLIWGGVELIGASHVKRELIEAHEEKRKQQIVRELEAQEKSGQKS